LCTFININQGREAHCLHRGSYKPHTEGSTLSAQRLILIIGRHTVCAEAPPPPTHREAYRAIPTLTHTGRHTGLYTLLHLPREAYRLYTPVTPTQEGIPGYIHLYTPREAYRAIYTPYTPREVYRAIYTLIHPERYTRVNLPVYASLVCIREDTSLYMPSCVYKEVYILLVYPAITRFTVGRCGASQALRASPDPHHSPVLTRKKED